MGQKRKIAVLGATGSAGKAVVLEALREGYSVRALARTPSKLDIENPDFKVIQGNAEELDTIMELLSGCDAAISTLGPGFDKDVAKKMVSTAATQNVIQAMGQLNIKRYIVMSGASVVLPGDRTTSLANLVTRFVFPFLLGDILRDKYSEHKLLEASALDWTLVRCPLLKDEEHASQLIIQKGKHKSLWVNKTSLAAFFVSQISDTAFLGTGVFACSTFVK